jgi:hypothetical protein
MSSRKEALASLLTVLICDDLAGIEFDVALFADETGLPVGVVMNDLARLRKRRCLTPDYSIDWRKLPQADLRSVLEFMFAQAMGNLQPVIQTWAEANPAAFEGWSATADFEAHTVLPLPRLSGF